MKKELINKVLMIKPNASVDYADRKQNQVLNIRVYVSDDNKLKISFLEELRTSMTKSFTSDSFNYGFNIYSFDRFNSRRLDKISDKLYDFIEKYFDMYIECVKYYETDKTFNSSLHSKFMNSIYDIKDEFSIMYE